MKPDNILFSKYGEPMLADFGIAQITGQTATRTGTVTASVEHAAPEILDGKRPSEASDQYALASTIYAAILGRAPFVHQDDDPMIPMITRMATEPPPDLRPRGVPDGVCAVLERSLAKTPAQRFPKSADLAQALRAAAPAEAATTPAPPPTPSPASATRQVDVPPSTPPPSSPPPPTAPPPTPSAGAPPPRRPRLGRRAIALATVAAIVVGGTVAGIVAATSGGAAAPARAPPPPASGPRPSRSRTRSRRRRA